MQRQQQKGWQRMRPTDQSTDDVGMLMHELAERLQALGNYIGAVRHCSDSRSRDGQWQDDVLNKAAQELARSYEIFHHIKRLVGEGGQSRPPIRMEQFAALTADWWLGDERPERAPLKR